ncbi:Rrf2 family transcriptional regulator [bacterium]|jgi:DNA-binding IscR family transcriptional regulator|nr:Rrf2 family transcriptional regulator [bacterium]
MRISYKGDYALKAMLDLALHYNAELVTGHDMAQRIDAPIKFMGQVLLELRKGGFIESRRGNIGGYMLSRPPGKISVGEVVRYIDGPIEPIACLKDKYSNCADINRCVFKKLWNKVYQATADIVDNVTFEELASEVNSSNQVLAYSI